MIKIENLDPIKIKIHKKSNKNILIYYDEYEMVKDLRYVKINNVNPLYLILIINKMNGYFKEINGNKYLTLIPTNESKDIITILRTMDRNKRSD